MPKLFKITADKIIPVAKGLGGCIATDRITVDGAPVGYMIRDTPADPMDSGWQFFAGDESEEYMNNLENSGVYDVNTIANYDPKIIPHLGKPYGTALAVNPEGEWVEETAE